eukprot:GHVU01115329.1.p1 GENE.GHVU01115329.1~~GHVU01115329.1.p1  ORF type:complete len:208 (+),score=16.64 GHVU01115329.1:442-1065(+)
MHNMELYYYVNKMLTAFILSGLAFKCISCADKYVTVSTKSGTIRGILESTSSGDVTRFLGIPFAEPPVEKLRFMPPQPVKQWTETLDALKQKLSCIQVAVMLALGNLGPFGEDCLYLNIITPGNASQITNKPVLVYIYGGAFTMGATKIYDGTKFASQGDVIFVTIAYRLGIFGSLFSKRFSIDGNQLLLDQLEALKWLKANIQVRV